MQTTRRASLSTTPADDEERNQRPADDGRSGRQPGAETAPPRRQIQILVGVAALVLLLDSISKLIVVAKLSNRAPVRLLGGFLKLEETRNAGAAFSIGTGATFVFAFVAIAVIVVILRSARRLFSGPWAIVLGLLLGGATGNLVDRIARSPGLFRGQVVDWIRLPHFAVFNLADSAITVGGVLAVLLAMTGRQIDGTVVSMGYGGRHARTRAVDAPRGATPDDTRRDAVRDDTQRDESPSDTWRDDQAPAHSDVDDAVT